MCSRIAVLHGVYKKATASRTRSTPEESLAQPTMLLALTMNSAEAIHHTMSSGNEICWHFCTHHEALLYATALPKLKRFTHAMRAEVLRTREITSVVCGRNAEKWPTTVRS